MLGYVAKVHQYLIKHLIFSFKARRGLQKQNCSRQTPRRLTLRDTARSLTPRSVRLFWICGKFNCQLCAVLANFRFFGNFRIFFEISQYGFYIPWKLRFLKIKFFCLTPRSVSQFWIFKNNKNEFLSKTILACLSGARMGLIHEINKCQNIL